MCREVCCQRCRFQGQQLYSRVTQNEYGIMIRGHSITTWTRCSGSGIKVEGGQKLFVFVHAQGIKTVHTGEGGGGKKGQTSVHIVVECPLNCYP